MMSILRAVADGRDQKLPWRQRVTDTKRAEKWLSLAEWLALLLWRLAGQEWKEEPVNRMYQEDIQPIVSEQTLLRTHFVQTI